MTKHFKIVSLMAENIKRIKAVEIKPDSNLIRITGPNGAGKTSVLDAIWWAIAGTSHIQAVPIRKGEHTARIKLDLGELIVTRKFHFKKDSEGNQSAQVVTSLVVENAEGARYAKPQEMLDDLISALTFDPLAFARSPANAQFEQLKKLVPGVDFDLMAAMDRGDREKRTEYGREERRLRAAAEAIILPANVPDALGDENELIEQIGTAGEFNGQIDQRANVRANVRDKIQSLLQLAESDEVEAKRLMDRAAERRAEAEHHQKRLDEAEPLPEKMNVDDLRAKLAKMRDDNKAFQIAAQKKKLIDEANAAAATVADFTKRMQERQKKKEEAIAAAQLPVSGLALGDGIVTFNGLPLDQAADAEQIRVSMGVAMAMNPRLRVVRIRNGSLVDSKGMALIASIAAEHDFQVWMEQVDETGKIGIVMEDGEVKTVNHETPPTPAAETTEAQPQLI